MAWRVIPRRAAPAGAGHLSATSAAAVGARRPRSGLRRGRVWLLKAEAPKDEGEAVCAVLNEIATTFSKVAKARVTVIAAVLDFIARLKHQKIEHQRQQLHRFLHHRRGKSGAAACPCTGQPPAGEIPCRGRCFRCRSRFHRLSRGGQQPQNRKRQQHITPEGGACR